MYSLPSASQISGPSPRTNTISGATERLMETTPPGINRRLASRICWDFGKVGMGLNQLSGSKALPSIMTSDPLDGESKKGSPRFDPAVAALGESGLDSPSPCHAR